MVDKLVMDIREFSASVSGQPLPVGIMMFGVGSYVVVSFLSISKKLLPL